MVITRSRSQHDAQAASHSMKKRKKIESRSERDWTALPQGPLHLISEQLQSEIDVVRFRSVCSSWRSAAPRRQSLLVLAHSYGRQNRYALFALSGARIPNKTNISLCKSYFGSSHGWLAVLKPGTILFNPITGDRIDLPARFGLPAPALADMLFPYDLGFTLSSNPATTSDYTAAILNYEKRMLAIYKRGDKAWSVARIPNVEGGYSHSHSSFVFYKGLIYIAGQCRIFMCDPGAMEKVVRAHGLSCLDKFRICEISLVESCGDLLIVCLLAPPWENLKMLAVFKLKFGGSGWIKGVVKMESLGDQAIFVHPRGSFSVSASKFPGCKENCVYFNHGRGEYYKVINVADGIAEAELAGAGFDPFLLKSKDWIVRCFFSPSLL